MTWLSALLATEPSRPDDPTGAPNAGDGTLLADADPTAASELDPTLGPDDIALDVLPSTREGLHADHAARLSSVVPGGADREAARDAAEAYAKEGVGAGGFAATYAGAVDELVAETFDMVRDGRVDEAEAALRAGLDATLADAVAGLERYDELAGRDEDEHADAVLTIEEVLEAIPYPVYMLDADNRVIGWNYGHTALVGMDREEAMGKTAQESVIKATYSEGARKLTLADKVIDAPYDAHEAYDVEKVDTPYSEGHVYKDTSTATTLDDEEIEIVFWAVPIFDDDDDLVGVFEMLDDRTDEVRRREAMESLVGEVTDTLHRIGEGELTARAEFEGDADAVETELLDIVDAVNEMATDFQSLVAKVNARTGDLADSIGTAAEAARRIDDQLDDQNASLRAAADEMDDFSATMEEIAATSNEVASAAEQARAEVESGIESARDARAMADTVSETSASLVETVSELSSRMDEIEQVVEVISDVADQTNMLALNANIEAARAGEAGSGFAVVADQVKDLADETQSHTEEIAEHIERMEAQSRETVDAVERSHDQVNEVDEGIRATVDAFEEIADAVETAALDIEEVAEANDDQAARIEEATSMIREAREEADRVTETADTIVEETADGQEAVDELTAHVAELTE